MNPLSVVNWITLAIVYTIAVFVALPLDKDGKRQYKKAAMYSVPAYLLMASLANHHFYKAGHGTLGEMTTPVLEDLEFEGQ
jgi:hypothetical protein